MTLIGPILVSNLPTPIKFFYILIFDFIFVNKMTTHRKITSITNCLMIPVDILRTVITKKTKYSPDISTRLPNQNIYSDKYSQLLVN